MTNRAPSLGEVLPLARSVAYSIARTPSDVDDLVQEALLAYGALCRRTTAPGWRLIRLTFQRRMWRYYRRPSLPLVDLADERQISLHDIALADAPRVDDDLALDDYFRLLERDHGTLARTIAQQLLAPTGRCAAAVVHAGRRRRKHAPIRRHVICRALGVSRRTWFTTMRQIETFTRAWCAVA